MNHTRIIDGLDSIKINCHDPRCHQSFLQFSSDMHRWQEHINDRNWWLEREMHCLGLFRQHGYDLQSGVWYCLIAGHRTGWKGVASASLLLADGFTKQHPNCWPPQSASFLRRQLMDRYCTYLQTLISHLPLADNVQPLKQLANALILLQENAAELRYTRIATFQRLSEWLLSGINFIERPITIPVRPALSQGHIGSEQYLIPPRRNLLKRLKGRMLWGIIGMLAGIILMGAGRIHEPEVLLFSNQIWPGNPLFVNWQQKLVEEQKIFPSNIAYKQLSQQLDALERRLLNAEQRRKPYMTISELKTEVYKMQKIVNVQEDMFEYKLNELQLLRVNNKPIPASLMSSLLQKRDVLNDRYLYLTHDVLSSNELQ